MKTVTKNVSLLFMVLALVFFIGCGGSSGDDSSSNTTPTTPTTTPTTPTTPTTTVAKIYGIVKDAITLEPVTNFTVTLDNTQTQSFTSSTGSFELDNINLGIHKIKLSSNGYKDYFIFTNVENSNDINLNQLYMIPNEYAVDTEMIGNILDATNGNLVNNVTMKFYVGYNNTEGEPVKVINTTDGTYDVTLPADVYTIVITADGYNTAKYINTIVSQNNDPIHYDFTLNPINTNNDYALRAILTWGEYPTDEDSHLVAYDESTQTIIWHVYYGNMVSPNGDVKLDVDDTSSYGPETITMTSVNNNYTYKYYVNNFSGDGKLKDSNAQVVVYFNGQQYTFHIPNEDGNVWKVFEIKNGQLIPCTSNCVKSVSYDPDEITYEEVQTLLQPVKTDDQIIKESLSNSKSK